ncbi:unnamed protein product, partial [Prorocentrum cordatum]
MLVSTGIAVALQHGLNYHFVALHELRNHAWKVPVSVLSWNLTCMQVYNLFLALSFLAAACTVGRRGAEFAEGAGPEPTQGEPDPERAALGDRPARNPAAHLLLVCSTFVMALSYSRKALGWWPDGPAGMQGSCAARAVAAPLLAAGLGLASGRGCVYCAPAVAVSAATWALAFASLGPARPVVHWVLFAFAAVSFSLFCRLAENMAMNPRLSNTAQGAMRLPVDCISTFGTILIFQMLAQVGIGWLSEESAAAPPVQSIGSQVFAGFADVMLFGG